MRTLWILLGLFGAAACNSSSTPPAYTPPTRVMVAGAVHDAHDGKPLAAKLTLGDAALTTGNDGSFLFTGVATGAQQLRVERTGYHTLMRKLQVGTAGLDVDVLLFSAATPPPEAATNVTVVNNVTYVTNVSNVTNNVTNVTTVVENFPTTSRLTGRVRVYGSFDTVGVTVQLVNTTVTTTTLADGSYVLDGIAPGTYDITYFVPGPSVYAPVTLPQFQFFAGVAERLPDVPLYRGDLTYAGPYPYTASWHSPDGTRHILYDTAANLAFGTADGAPAPMTLERGYAAGAPGWNADGAYALMPAGGLDGVFLIDTQAWTVSHLTSFANGTLYTRFGILQSYFGDPTLVELATGRQMPMLMPDGPGAHTADEAYVLYNTGGFFGSLVRMTTATGAFDEPLPGARCALDCQLLPSGLLLIEADAVGQATLKALDPTNGTVYPTAVTVSQLTAVAPEGDWVVYQTPGMESYLVPVTGGTPRGLGQRSTVNFVSGTLFLATDATTGTSTLFSVTGVATANLADPIGQAGVHGGQFLYLANGALRRVDPTTFAETVLVPDAVMYQMLGPDRLLYRTSADELYAMAVTGGAATFLVATPYADVSSDGARLYYYLTSSPPRPLYRMATTGGAQQPLAPDVASYLVSPDGATLAYLDPDQVLHWVPAAGGVTATVGPTAQVRFDGNDMLEFTDAYAVGTNLLRLSDGARAQVIPAASPLSTDYFAVDVSITLPYYNYLEHRQMRKSWR